MRGRPKGFKQTEEWKKKVSLSHKDRVVSNETRKKISDSHKGIKLSDSHIKAISDSHKGKPTWNKGKKGLQVAWNKGKHPEYLQGKNHPGYGKEASWSKGDKNPNWKGGINPINDSIRKSLELKLWKRACLERDNFTDAKTGTRGGKLQVHHINNFAEFTELRTSLENGITLSKESHELFHHIYGRKNNTREQLIEFLSI